LGSIVRLLVKTMSEMRLSFYLEGF